MSSPSTQAYSAKAREGGRTAALTRARYEANQMTTVHSVPNRCDLWGDARYPGNCDGTLIKNLILRYDPRSVADPMEGSGTMRHVVAWLNEQFGLGISYWGGDLRSGFNLLKRPLPGRYDFVFLHPPAWDIIQYSDHGADLSGTRDYTLYLTRLRRCLARCAEAVNPGGRLAVLVSDVRKDHRLYPISRDVMNLDGDLGELTSVIAKVQHNCRSDGKHYETMREPRIRHECCVVFRKPLTRERWRPAEG